MNAHQAIEELEALITELTKECKRLNDSADNLLAMSYEQEREQARAAYVNASVIARGQALGLQREICEAEDRLRTYRREAGVVVLTEDQKQGMDDMGGLLGVAA